MIVFRLIGWALASVMGVLWVALITILLLTPSPHKRETLPPQTQSYILQKPVFSDLFSHRILTLSRFSQKHITSQPEHQDHQYVVASRSLRDNNVDNVAVDTPRMALVIGNGDYKQVPALSNPVNDARAIRDVLKQLGFSVTYDENTNRLHLEERIRQFAQQIPENAVALFYYAGHGVQVNGQNFLIPIDARMQTNQGLEDDVVRLDAVINQMEQSRARLNLLIIDACRDNPWRLMLLQNGRNIALEQEKRLTPRVRSLTTAQGTLIAFATSENQVASDGEGPHSPYTQALLKWLAQPNIEIGLMFRHVRDEVRQLTKGQQTPWENGAIVGEFYFSTTREPTAQMATSETLATQPTSRKNILFERPLRKQDTAKLQTEQEDEYWKSVQKLETNTLRKQGLEDYIKTYGNGKYVGLAKLQLLDLEKEAKQAPTTTTVKQETSDNNTSSETKTTAPEAVSEALPAAPQILNEADAALDDITRTQIQEALATLGFFHGRITGVFGPDTHGAIMAFQTAKGFEAKGFLTPQELIILFADQATKLRENPDLANQINKDNAPTWFVATTPEGKLGYVYGILGDPEHTTIEGGEGEAQIPKLTEEGSISLLAAAKMAEGEEGVLRTSLDRYDLKPFASKPPPAVGPEGTLPYKIAFNTVVYQRPAKFENEIGYLPAGSWVRIFAKVGGTDWYEIKSPEGMRGYIEGMSLVAPPQPIHSRIIK